MMSLCSAILLFTLVLATGSGGRPTTMHTTLRQLLRLQRRVPIMLQLDESIDNHDVPKRQPGGNRINQTMVGEICDALNTTHGILERVMKKIRDDIENQQHIDSLHDLQRYPPITQLQLPDTYTPDSRFIIATTYSYVTRVLLFSDTLKQEIEELDEKTKRLRNRSDLNRHIANALVQIHSGLGVGGYHGLLFVIRKLYFQFPDLVEHVSEDEHVIPLYLRSAVTRAEVQDNSYYVFINVQRLLVGLTRMMKTLS